MPTKRVLVTGASGLLGTALRAEAMTQPREFIWVTRQDADLEDFEATRRLIAHIQPDVILHTAAVVGGIRFNMEHPEELRDRNNRINENVLRAAFEHQVPKVVSFLSSCIFPESAPEPWDETMIHAGEPDSRQWGYAHAKRTLDQRSRELSQKSGGACRFVTLMPTAMFGANDNYHLERSHVIPAVLMKVRAAIRSGIAPVFWGSGRPRREFLFSRDMARVALWAIEHYDDLEPLIVSPPQDESVQTIVSEVAKQLAYHGPVQWDTQRPDGRLTRRTSQTKFKRLLPDFQFTPFSEALSQTVLDFRSRGTRLRGQEAPRVVFLDRDGVLNAKATQARYVRQWSEFIWMPGAKEAVKELKAAGYTILLISNQAGVGNGQMTEADLKNIQQMMQTELQMSGGSIDGFYYCLHRADAGCECRKPQPGLLLQAQKDFGMDFDQAVFIGDDQKDAEAGKAVNCPTLLVNSERTLLTIVRDELLKKGAAA